MILILYCVKILSAITIHYYTQLINDFSKTVEKTKSLKNFQPLQSMPYSVVRAKCVEVTDAGQGGDQNNSPKSTGTFITGGIRLVFFSCCVVSKKLDKTP